MKNKPIAILLLTSLFLGISGAPLAAANAEATPAKCYAAKVVYFMNEPAITLGKHYGVVRDLLGPPTEKITPDLWRYSHFRPRSDQAIKDGCRQLIIAFADDHVSEIYFANSRACQVLVSKAEQSEQSNEAILATIRRKQDGILISQAGD